MRFTRPDGEAVGNALFRQRMAELAIAFVERVVLADRERDLHAAQRVEVRGVVEVRQEVVGVDEVDVVVVMAAEEIFEGAIATGEVIASAQGDHFAEQPGMA